MRNTIVRTAVALVAAFIVALVPVMQAHAQSKIAQQSPGTTKSQRPNGTMNAAAALRGSEEVPSVTTNTTGTSRFVISRDRSTMQFTLNVLQGRDVMQAHIHCGPVGQNGPVVAWLFGNVPGGFDVHGRLASFTLSDQNIVDNSCNPQIETIQDLVRLIENGNAYVNVHTMAYPNGEVRGQIRLTNRAQQPMQPQPAQPAPGGQPSY